MAKESVQGVDRYYGPRNVDYQVVEEMASVGSVVARDVLIDLTDLPVVSDGVVMVYAGEAVCGAEIEVMTALDSAGNNATVTLGLRTSADAAIDDDGIDVAIAEAALDTAGKVVVCDGAMVDNATGLGGEVTENAYLYCVAANTPTAGVIRLRVHVRTNLA